MQAYIIRRLLLIIPTLFLVTVIIFLLVRLIPGDVVELMADEQEYLAHSSGEDLLEQIRHSLGLDLPFHVQYGHWVAGLFQGNLGKSLWTGVPITTELGKRWPVSFELGLFAMVIGLAIAIPIGVYSGVRQDTIGDYIGRSIAVAFIALPSFWLGTMIMVFPSLWWGWSPPMEYIPFVRDPLGNLGQFLIPSFLLGMVMSGGTMRMVRTMMLEVLRQDYIRTAWSKGLRERVVVMRHVLRNAMLPVVTMVGMQIPILIGGSVILEQIFCLPGVGRLMINIINTRDYVMLSGINLIIAVVVMLNNLMIDLTYGFLDPRVRVR